MTGNEICRMQQLLVDMYLYSNSRAINACFPQDDDPVLYGNIIRADYYKGGAEIIKSLRVALCEIIANYTYGNLNVEFDGIKQALIDIGEELKKL